MGPFSGKRLRTQRRGEFCSEERLEEGEGEKSRRTLERYAVAVGGPGGPHIGCRSCSMGVNAARFFTAITFAPPPILRKAVPSSRRHNVKQTYYASPR